jgi:hypothetical protein
VKNKFCLLLLGLSLMPGCYRNAQLYPVQGPLSAQTPVPVLGAKIAGTVNPQEISIVVSDGEKCKRQWTRYVLFKSLKAER